MTNMYREQLLASIEEMEREQFRQKVRRMGNEDLENAVCDSVGVPRGTQFSIEQLEIVIESHRQGKR